MSDLRRRIELLEAAEIKPVTLTLDDGTIFRYPAGALALHCEVMAQSYERLTTGKEGPLLEIIRRAVRSQGLGTEMFVLIHNCLEPATPDNKSGGAASVYAGIASERGRRKGLKP